MLHKRDLVLLEFSILQYSGRGSRDWRFVAVLIINIPIVSLRYMPRIST